MKELIDFCDVFCQTHPYPLHIYYHGNCIWKYPEVPFDMTLPLKEIFLLQKKTAFLHQTSENLLFGGVFDYEHNILLLLGPVAMLPVDIFLLHEIMKKYDIESSKKEDLMIYLNRTQGYTLSHFKSILHQLCFFLNREIDSSVNEAFLSSKLLLDKINSQNIEYASEYDKSNSFQLAYEFEQKYLTYVRTGNIKDAHHMVASQKMHVGVLASTGLRQLKNQMICIITLVTRAAIEGGLELSSAYQLSDFYIQKIENALTAATINEILDTMFLDFTERTQKTVYLLEAPKDLSQCLRFIRESVYRPIKIKDAANYIGLSISQLERRFRSTLGFSPGYFIVRCKLEEAKNLLAYTNKSLSEISQILNFSSQAYFSNVFKKNFGMTPKEFRQSIPTCN